MVVNFSIIGEKMKIFDTDEMDVWRDTVSENPNTGEVTEATAMVVEKQPCHISYKINDRPDTVTAGTMPVTQLIRVDFPAGVDVKNGDYVKLRRKSNGVAFAEINGFVGMLSAYPGRSNFYLQVRKDV